MTGFPKSKIQSTIIAAIYSKILDNNGHFVALNTSVDGLTNNACNFNKSSQKYHPIHIENSLNKSD